MTTRSDVLFTAHTTTSQLQIAVPVPVGETWLVKSAIITNLNATNANCVVQLTRSSTGTNARFFSGTLNPSASSQSMPWAVMEGGDQLVVSSDKDLVHFWISGTRLPAGPA